MRKRYETLSPFFWSHITSYWDLKKNLKPALFLEVNEFFLYAEKVEDPMQIGLPICLKTYLHLNFPQSNILKEVFIDKSNKQSTFFSLAY